MHDHRIEVIGVERAALAADVPVGAEHEVIDDQLAMRAEQVGEVPLAALALEHVILVDLHPGQRAARFAEPIALLGECFLLRQQRGSRREPLAPGNDGMADHGRGPC
jgi:hypothetical protein